jgi:CheY-like chemotaxis protein
LASGIASPVEDRDKVGAGMCTILTVEDDASVREMLCRAFTEKGFSAYGAASG